MRRAPLLRDAPIFHFATLSIAADAITLMIAASAAAIRRWFSHIFAEPPPMPLRQLFATFRLRRRRLPG